MLKDLTQDIFDAYFEPKKGVSDAHIESFNDFLSTGLRNIILNPVPGGVIKATATNKSTNDQVTMYLEFHDIYLDLPSYPSDNKTLIPLYPQMCRHESRTYHSNLFVNYSFKVTVLENGTNHPKEVYTITKEEGQKIFIGKIPIMVKSDLCNTLKATPNQLKILNEDINEQGGYFIIGGKEYVIMFHENKCEKIYRNIDTVDDKSVYSCWIQSKQENTYEYPYYTILKLMPDKKIYATVSISKYTKMFIPIKVLFTALDIPSDQQIAELTCYGRYKNDCEEILAQALTTEYIKKTKDKTKEKEVVYAKSKEEALLIIGDTLKYSNYYKKKFDKTELIAFAESEILGYHLFPHIGKGDKQYEKVLFLSHMLHELLLMKIGVLPELDRDDYSNKIAQTSGVLYGQLFKHFYNLEINDLMSSLTKEAQAFSKEKKYSAILKSIFKEKYIKSVTEQISVGKWPAGGAKGYNFKVGVSQFIERKSGPGELTMAMYKVILPINDQKASTVDVHKTHSSQIGFIDHADSPDGKKIGVINHRAMTCEVTGYVNPKNINLLMSKYEGIVTPNVEVIYELDKYAKIFVNENWNFCIPKEKINDLVTYLRKKRRTFEIHKHTTIYADYRLFEIKIYTDAGRFVRPLYIVDDGDIMIRKYKGPIVWETMLGKGIIEYLTPLELQHNCIVAEVEEDFDKYKTVVDFTHCELDRCVIFSQNTNAMPFATANQGPRLIFGNAMRKQSISSIATNEANRWDKSVLHMNYFQKPLVDTKTTKYIQNGNSPGINVRLAIFKDLYNFEDAIVCNKKVMLTNHTMEVNNYCVFNETLESGHEKLTRPDAKTTKNYKHINSYHAIAANGEPIRGTFIMPGDIILGKVGLINKSTAEKDGLKYLYVDKSMIYNGSLPGIIYDYTIGKADKVKIKIKILNIRPVTQGDKLASRYAQKSTVGAIRPEQDIIFASNGDVPTLLFNPHAIITRMTIGHLLDIVRSTKAANDCEFADGTPFGEQNIIENLIDILKELGLNEMCNEQMFDPYTGEPLECKIFTGMIYYERLKHLVADKIHGSSECQKTKKTGQPVKGKQKGGGSKFGYMEKNAAAGYGAFQLLKEMFNEKSDGFTYYINNDTGLICAGNEYSGIYGSKAITRIKAPWGLAMLVYYLMSVGIITRFETEGPIY
jgi:DNA-directed RNA polymerase II subunit RPB2